MTETIDAEIVEPGTELATRETAAPTLFGTDEPRLIIAKASGVADALKDVIVKQKMAIRIGQSEYIKVEGWTTLGALLGVFPKVEWTRELTDGEGVSLGWEAAVVVVNGQGVEIGRAEAQCLRAERNWKGRDDFALRSMAQTRAMGKALRMPLGWIAVMAGYEATPAEEMPLPDRRAVPEVQSDDVPFDQIAAQGQLGADAQPAHETGTGGADLTSRLLQLGNELGNRDQVEQNIQKNKADHAGRADLHQRWLKRQIAIAEEKLAEVTT